jgi:acetylornithine deacetylase/succinyl-diaminopimelate desuccinylase-like protein
MTDLRQEALNYAHQHQDDFLGAYKTFLSIPSVSTDPAHQADMVTTAEWVAEQLKSMGFSRVQVFPTARHPVVFGVKPAEPLDLWHTGAFEPTIRGENIFARGASDMKGQIAITLNAVKSVLTVGKSPVNFKYIVEGEEEIGSPNLMQFIEEHKELLACDLCLNPDSGMISETAPTIFYGLRGLAYFELRIYGPTTDLHSGLFGGVVHNPANVLAKLIAGMHDEHGHIMLPGFYDKVRPLSVEERAAFAALPIDDQHFLDVTGAPQLWGEEGYTASERVGARPTLDVNGLLSGFTGAGSKTVIAAWAMAKISTRLVPDQDAHEVHQALLQYLHENAPKTVRWEVIPMSGGPAVITDLNHPGVKSLALALEQVWGTPPLYKREGGSIPVVVDMRKILGIESVLTGFGLPDDNIHAPNEKQHLPTWFKGVDAIIHFIYNLKA